MVNRLFSLACISNVKQCKWWPRNRAHILIHVFQLYLRCLTQNKRWFNMKHANDSGLPPPFKWCGRLVEEKRERCRYVLWAPGRRSGEETGGSTKLQLQWVVASDGIPSLETCLSGSALHWTGYMNKKHGFDICALWWQLPMKTGAALRLC